ncbi:vitamin B12 ABC transporter substrate-binding protein BtuF [Xenorhabdus nematophila]|uniref:Vitamin B12-binding protein n=1 Tax=Xenorhabdus nematophila (strain ATCC 19061 / DSM 3370 / CCUG 14189 / LMG 1036 / NCIMB 9965 / AN6) TaxID=406817 RepID=D3VKZ9_XENNA|nr:vitamin B12 ABC transporter substrate-binding protein BtuF [Xenorhabdus nematophila]AYA42505.1 vitamin B12 ABC transporter substrate-binding protein BtuF [Xenorhabdus nematophila]MBA0019785.1 vitamin B12 ABC transporter substrate-binding protein BtuF [Xenorhabdus nematophila]MCB4425382.1 vitamin B12 ABC transporter substrate-binding protein BtuF [Xenorhabdus nematophila]QNJ38393.1 vitamin B12 ABC transporter substrate-binding protein BtuF [Xenorhabdus nematophila]CBJ88958.1 cyano-cobalamin 
MKLFLKTALRQSRWLAFAFFLYSFLSAFSAPLYAASRVISLAPSTTELAYAAGMGDKMIAVSAYSDYPEAAKKLEQVADWQGINVERIIALKPDLILAWRGGNPQRPLDQLAALGIPIFYSDVKKVEDISTELERLADYSPRPDVAKKTASEIRQKFNQLKQDHANLPPKQVFLQFGMNPIFTSSSHTIQSEIVATCGGRNIFADSPVPWPQVNREQVLTRKPEVIVIGGTEEQKQRVADFWQPQMKVNIIALNDDWFSRAGPRIILATEQLCQQLKIAP